MLSDKINYKNLKERETDLKQVKKKYREIRVY